MTFKLADNNVMVDLETLGNGSHSVIISMGAVRFNETGLFDVFYRRVDPQSCVDVGLRSDMSTIMWWMQQSDEARAAFKEKGDHIADVLAEFAVWMPRNACLWGNGATFDNVILSNAYKAVALPQPWEFWNDRCYRTMKNLFKDVPAPKFDGAKHNALDDAIHQAKHLITIAGGSYE